MILINLLPHREAAQRRATQAFQYVLLGCVALGLFFAALAHFWFDHQSDDQDERNRYLRQEIAQLDAKITEIASLEQEITALHERQKAVEDLQANRNTPVHMLNELVRRVPEGTYLQSLRQNGQSVEIQGAAQSNERVSQLLRALSAEPTWFKGVALRQTEAANVNANASSASARKVANFTITFTLTRPLTDAEKAAQAAQSGLGLNFAAPGMAGDVPRGRP